MPKFALNDKKAAGRERKATVAAEKKRQETERQEQKESQLWQIGIKDESKKAQEEEKRVIIMLCISSHDFCNQAEKFAQKKEREKLLAAEEAELKSKSSAAANSAGKIKQESFSSECLSEKNQNNTCLLEETELKIERHPERRMKAAYSEFEAKEYPIFKAHYPTLKHSQLLQLIQKKWKKSPDNPFNKPFENYKSSIKTDTVSNEDLTLNMGQMKLS